MRKERLRDILIIAFVILFVPALVLSSYFYAHGDTHLNPDGTFTNPVQDSDSSFKMTFRQVSIPDVTIDNCSGWVVASVVNSSWSVRFGPENFTDGPNLSLGVKQAIPPEKEAEWRGVNFTILYGDTNHNARVDSGDTIRVVCSQPLRPDEKYNIQINYHSSQQGSMTVAYETFYT